MDNKELRIDLLRKIYGCDKDKLLDEVKKKYNFVKQRESIMQEELDNIIKTKTFDKERLNSREIEIYSLEEYEDLKKYDIKEQDVYNFIEECIKILIRKQQLK
jgi:chorismate mutase